MDAPKQVFVDCNGKSQFIHNDGKLRLNDYKYIRADLVDQLIGYAVHDADCKSQTHAHFLSWPSIPFACTCGLSDLIREVRGKP